MKTVLLTGFEPFGGEACNPSWEAVRALQGKQLSDGSRIEVALLPCVFGQALSVLEEKIQSLAPVIVVCVGQAGGRAELSVERVAINLDDARIPDNLGVQPIDVTIKSDGPAAYFSTLPVKAIVAALRAQGIPATVSHTAGTFVCNHVFYGLMDLAARDSSIERAGFVHIPYLPAQAAQHAGAPSMSLQMMVTALELLLETTLKVTDDLKQSGGSLF